MSDMSEQQADPEGPDQSVVIIYGSHWTLVHDPTVPTPAEGTRAYVSSTDVEEGYYVFTNGEWQRDSREINPEVE